MKPGHISDCVAVPLQWEYMIEPQCYAYDGVALLEHLTAHGLNGWQLCGYTPRDGYAVYKRRVLSVCNET